jgi:hypothetical protein
MFSYRSNAPSASLQRLSAENNTEKSSLILEFFWFLTCSRLRYTYPAAAVHIPHHLQSFVCDSQGDNGRIDLQRVIMHRAFPSFVYKYASKLSGLFQPS